MSTLNDCYNPQTGEHISTVSPADWMGRAGKNAPSYNQHTQGCFWRNEHWEIDDLTTSEPIPQTVSMRQARLALLGAGLLDNVNAAINSLSSPQKEAALIEWEYSQEVQRDKELVAMLAPALGLDDAALDQLFIQAATL